ncbi:MAG TPA: hypothetical protein PLQ95_03165 [Thiobacillus sp.]|nr:hypothetical protein [Thiobacillus sp.]
MLPPFHGETDTPEMAMCAGSSQLVVSLAVCVAETQIAAVWAFSCWSSTGVATYHSGLTYPLTVVVMVFLKKPPLEDWVWVVRDCETAMKPNMAP